MGMKSIPPHGKLSYKEENTMVQKEHLMDIRLLAKQGYSHRAIARMTGLSRITVKKYLTEGIQPVYKKIGRMSKLAPYYNLVQGWLSQENYQATRIHELLIAQGYNGSYDTVKRYVGKYQRTTGPNRVYSL
jgi:transposase